MDQKQSQQISISSKNTKENNRDLKLSEIPEISSIQLIPSQIEGSSFFYAMKKRMFSKSINMNILVCGESGIGKTSFINTFRLVFLLDF